MKYLLILLLMVQLSANKVDWEFERINYYFENDLFGKTDSAYSDGSRFSLLLYRPDGANEWLNIPFTEGFDSAHFISLSLTQQIFTPTNLMQSTLTEKDRPYAGWLYMEMGLHQSSTQHLDSLSLQVGIVGPASGMEQLQEFVHKATNSTLAQGWDNQLSNELGLQLNYQHKWRFISAPVWGVGSSIIPYVGGEFGNIAIKANAGTIARVGWNVPQDFGSTSIDEGGENGIPVRRKCLVETPSVWSFNFQFSGGGTVVVRDIFLDGNTFTQSHSVEKKLFKAYGAYGFSGRYENFNFEYIRTFHTQQFEQGSRHHNIGSIILSYLFSSL